MTITRFVLLACMIAMMAACSNTQTLPDGRKVNCQPVYGNWCGKGYPADGYNPTPVDVWDRACRDHDRCYETAGGDDSAIDRCDRALTEKLTAISKRGVPVPRQMRNAYNFFADNLPYRSVFISFSDLFDANSLDCRGTEGQAARFCECGGGNFIYQIDAGGCACPGPYGYYPGRVISTRRY